MYEVLIFIAITIIALLIYKQQAAIKKYSKLKRSIKNSNDSLTSEREKQKQLQAIDKQREKERKIEAARHKKVIDQAYKDTSKAISDKKSILFKKVFNELLSEYMEEEEEKRKLYQAASDE
ncbi:MAG: hypothetical protein RBR97_07115 [Bacteroidales bacterium]|nr:hypothetical protein [Bacteroidales bacterium]